MGDMFFLLEKSKADTLSALGMLIEKYREGQKERCRVFMDLERVFDTMTREELWYCLRKARVMEKYVRVM